MNMNPRERFEELAAEHALVGLEPVEEAELSRLTDTFPDGARFVLEMERTAAALALSAVGRVERLGPAMVDRMTNETVRRGAPMQQTAVLQQTAVMPFSGPPPVHPAHARASAGPVGQVAPSMAPVIPLQRPAGGKGLRIAAVSGWLAAAAAIALAVGAWSFRGRETTTVAIEESAAAARTALLAKAGTKSWAWSPNEKDPAGRTASGDVVWNAAEQRGFMRFKGLAKNDARASVYQLWIFDKTRDDRYPVDGGVFSIDDETGEVVIPITARLAVADPTLFAVTVEKPDGVVVSSRERIVTTAKAL